MTDLAPAMSQCQKAQLVAARLQRVYGRLLLHPSRDGVGELVATILSQNTSDHNSTRAYAALRNRFPDWQSVESSPSEDVAASISSGGLALQKAPVIQSALRTIRERYGNYDLTALENMPISDARSTLTSLKGVGPKTASCVLLFGLGMPAMPVDTHVQRVATRIGVCGGSRSPDRTQELLETCLGPDPGDIYALHMNLIRHGRQVCVARAPRCGQCQLTDLCNYWRSDHIELAPTSGLTRELDGVDSAGTP